MLDFDSLFDNFNLQREISYLQTYTVTFAGVKKYFAIFNEFIQDFF